MFTLPSLPFAVDLVAALVFAVTGALVASRKEMDIVGFIWLAIMTGVGGGTVRDLILGVPVFSVEDASPVVVCIVTAVIVHFTAHFAQSRYSLILWFDAAGMALVTIAGAAKAAQMGVGPVVAVAMGVVTATVRGRRIRTGAVGHTPAGNLCNSLFDRRNLLRRIPRPWGHACDSFRHWHGDGLRYPLRSPIFLLVIPHVQAATGQRHLAKNQPLRGHF